jgi:hypothetical protein
MLSITVLVREKSHATVYKLSFRHTPNIVQSVALVVLVESHLELGVLDS